MPKATEKRTDAQEEEIIEVEDEDIETDMEGHSATKPVEA